jgi:hypothetical protein
MRFSERIGAKPAPVSGLNQVTTGVRTALWNALHEVLFPIPPHGSPYNQLAYSNTKFLWNRLGWRTDLAPHAANDAKQMLSNYWFGCEWSDFFDAFESAVLVAGRQRTVDRAPWFEQLNNLLEQQGCAYRFISEQLAPLTNPAEMTAVAAAAESAIPAVASHIRDAMRYLPPNDNPSARNCVKESISAVEAALKSLTNSPNSTLAAALPEFERQYGKLHPALRLGLEKLYGYTSDEGGIRHALVEETAKVTVDDARFMLVACSAFANYLVALSSKKQSL